MASHSVYSYAKVLKMARQPLTSEDQSDGLVIVIHTESRNYRIKEQK